MNKNILFPFLIGLILIGCQPNKQLPIVEELNTNWHFQSKNDTIWRSATVPGNVFTDLLDHQLIEDPFIKTNEKKVQWVSDSSWVYKTTLKIDKKTFSKKHIELNFEGLDTYAKVYLNEQLILNSNNAFRQFNIDIKSIVKETNELQIEFESTQIQEEIEKKKLPYELPEGNRVFTRKAQFQYGWDWGPKLNTSGIWKGVYLKSWDDILLEDIFIKQGTVSKEKAELSAEVKIISDKETDAKIVVKVNQESFTKSVQLKKGSHTYQIPITIDNPKLWWPHNLGTPYLYDFKVEVTADKKIVGEKSVKKGIRTIELITENDAIGESFYFKVNDIPVYIKGANYIPQNSFQNKVTPKHYDTLLNDVVDANMNMLRVWGGGIYENDIFYELCDEKGILVWQDFMFACAMYPGDNNFLNNIQQEAIDQVTRLRNHSSIALWCGNNENSEGWHRWGWQTGKTEEQKKEIWSNYLKVFDSILPNMVNSLSDNTSYWESSPKYGRGNSKYKIAGDAHDWWVWHDGYPFEHFEENIPRFMSEFGFQSFPSFETINEINQKDSIDIHTAAIKSHQKHSRGFQLIEEYMKRNFPIPASDEDYVYVSQLLQAKGITMGIEAQRRARPYNMGTLYWQLNDCWPVISWSSIDYFGNWKALHYKAKKSFQNLLISSHLKEKQVSTYLVNDNLKPYTDTLSVKIIDFFGKELWSKKQLVFVPKNTSSKVFDFSLDSLNINLQKTLMVASFKNETALFYFVKPKELDLRAEKIVQNIRKVTGGFEIELSSTTLQKEVFLYTKEKGRFSDNFFDVLPNSIKTILFKTKAKSLEDLQIKTLNGLSFD